MAKPVVFDPTSYLSDRDSLLITLFIAVIIHIVIILGINFTSPHPEKISGSIDITLINTPAKQPPKKSKFLAQEHQIGTGDKSKKPEHPPQKLASKGNSQVKQFKKALRNKANLKQKKS